VNFPKFPDFSNFCHTRATTSDLFPEIHGFLEFLPHQGHYERLPFKSSVQEVISSVIKGALSLHASVVTTFRKTAANFHYEFNIRHLAGVFDGMLQARPTEFTDPEKAVLLWVRSML
jgi:hypothetical protein